MEYFKFGQGKLGIDILGSPDDLWIHESGSSVEEVAELIVSCLVTDCSSLEDNVNVQVAILLADTIESLSVVNVLTFETSGDSGQFVEALTVTGNMFALDELVGHSAVQWALGHYHEVDKSIIVSSVSRDTNVRFKRRSVRKR